MRRNFHQKKWRRKYLLGAWEQRKLGEVVKINGRIGFRGYTQADIIRKEDGGILAFSPTNIINNKLDFNVKNTYITKDKYYESPEIMVKNGDILFVKTGSTLGKSASVSNLNEEATINPQIVILRATSYFISEFISSYLISNNILKQVAQTRIGGAVPTLTETEIKRFQISAPKGKEQQKIGTLFKQLDDTIALHQRKIEQLKLLKQAFLQKMLANQENVPELRFADFDEEWEPRKLLDVANIVGGGTPNTNNPEFWDGDIDWYSPAEIGEQSYVNNSRKKISYLGLQKSSAKILPVGTVLFTSRAGIGNTAILAKEGATNQGFQSIIPHKDKLDSYFIYSRTPELKRYGELSGAGSTFIEVSGKQMANMSLLFPNLKEQQKIGSFFKQIDNTISLHKKKLSNIKKLKKACLQSMFI
ncbi:restriction endonuclease subunit S [Enterococcus casseliflavus]|uniref:restriction endonuclease subunit S n=1 Tax=Enterococcus casseliflavus TaxID=37734 RepID=UPI002FBDBAE8